MFLSDLFHKVLRRQDTVSVPGACYDDCSELVISHLKELAC
jgi:hypothetical protein